MLLTEKQVITYPTNSATGRYGLELIVLQYTSVVFRYLIATLRWGIGPLKRPFFQEIDSKQTNYCSQSSIPREQLEPTTSVFERESTVHSLDNCLRYNHKEVTSP